MTGPLVHVRQAGRMWQVVMEYPPVASRAEAARDADLLRYGADARDMGAIVRGHQQGYVIGKALAEATPGDPEELLRAVLVEATRADRAWTVRLGIPVGARDGLRIGEGT